MNSTHSGGENNALELRIDRKTYVNADGVAVDVIRGLQLRLGAGEFGALIGPSGCGKTTVLRIVAGLDTAFDGECRWPGERRLGVVFQEPCLLPWRTVDDNIRLVLPPDRAKADLTDLIGTLGLASHRAHYPGELSLGLARRVAIARAFAINPDLLLLDEPFVSLDEAVAARLREELKALTGSRNVTTLMVTHDLDEAVQLADHLFFLSDRPARVVLEHRLTVARALRTDAFVRATTDELRAALSRLDR
ncbi:MAG: ABC transporter ATP-binding protein [Xanthobacteraceae bacterium]|nr:ABC transporter ATP-binding protein [Xanthobacteraceae bacterium]